MRKRKNYLSYLQALDREKLPSNGCRNNHRPPTLQNHAKKKEEVKITQKRRHIW
jgi:hypothetical protein